MKVRAARGKLMHYAFDPPNWAAATELEAVEWVAFMEWIALIRQSGLRFRWWNEAFAQVAEAAAVVALGTVQATESECMALLVVKHVRRLAAIQGADKVPSFGCTEAATSTLWKSAEGLQ